QMSAPWTTEWYHGAANGRYLAANGIRFGAPRCRLRHMANLDKTFAQLGTITASQEVPGMEKTFHHWWL
ncbi:MAG: hypothetical protein ACLVKA_08365, partial [Collinsella aerofaciens]